MTLYVFSFVIYIEKGHNAFEGKGNNIQYEIKLQPLHTNKSGTDSAYMEVATSNWI